MSTAQKLVPQTQLAITPLQPAIGAEIGNVDLSLPISDALRDEIKATLLQYKVVFFRDQQIDADQQAAFAARFGKLYTHPNNTRHDNISSIHQIAAVDFGKYEQTRDPKTVESGYHTDTSWRLVPTWGAVLRAIDLPEVGGDTIWVDAAAAYDGLSDPLKERLDGLHVTHDYRASLNRLGLDYPIVAHPLVRTHRETGRKTLWVNFTQRPYIIGLDLEESRQLLRSVLEAYRKPDYQVRFSWRPGSVAFWDNRAAVHYAVRNYGDYPRLLERVLIADEAAYEHL
jgi:alpha-ketoglutarate-dependent sulfate ester dioxygenase